MERMNILIAAILAAGLASGELLLFDDFEYTVSREIGTDCSRFFTEGGWSYVKANNCIQHPRGKGFIYTTDSIPGYAGQFPGTQSGMVLALEGKPRSMFNASDPGDVPQTDFYLKYGDGSVPDTVPADVWFQFWIYVNYYDDPTDANDQKSRIHNRNKFIYPCNGPYPCQSEKWLMSIGRSSSEPRNYNAGQDIGDYPEFSNDPPSVGELFFISRSDGSSDLYNGYMGAQASYGDSIVRANTWTLLKMHYDTRPNVNWKHEVWMRPMGQDWVKITDYESGVRPTDLDWPEDSSTHPLKLQPGGHSVFAMPTTWGDASPTRMQAFDIWIYMDDFAMATDETSLPVYGTQVPCVPAHAADSSPCDGHISAAELSAYMAQWRQGTSISLAQLMEAIRIWKG